MKDPRIIDGKALAGVHELALKEKLHELSFIPRVVSILIGDDAPSVLYTRIKKERARDLGIDFQAIRLPEDVPLKQVREQLDSLNNDETIHGIMFQLPFPQPFKNQDPQAEDIIQAIIPSKDMDGLTHERLVLPAAAQATMSILDDEQIEVQGKQTVVIGASDLVGKPVADALEKRGAHVTICDSKTPDLSNVTRGAEIIVCAAGVPGILKGEMVSEGVVVIDIGAEKRNGRVLGDVDFKSVLPKVSKITPVPGGVGPMTVISLMENVVKLVSKHHMEKEGIQEILHSVDA